MEYSTGSTVTTQRYSETILKKTKRRSGTSGELGNLYEKKILMLVLYNALNEKYNFKLDTNVNDAGAFDDVVFTYKGNDEIEKSIYLQSKHYEDRKKTIKYESFLLSGNHDFALYKYFIDYKEIVNRTDDEMQCKYFIIYTNADLSCPKANRLGLRKLSPKPNRVKMTETEDKSNGHDSKDDSFIFKKMILSEHSPLKLFFTKESPNAKQYPAFYQFSDANAQGDDNEIRIIDILRNKFRTIDAEEKHFKLPSNNHELESLLTGYIKSLVIAVDQYNQDKLGNHIKEKIKDPFNYLNGSQKQSLSPEKLKNQMSQREVDFVFEYVLKKITEWARRSKAEPLTEKDDFFNQAIDGFKSIPASYPTLVYKNELDGFNIQFIDGKYREVMEFVLSKKQLWLISSETPWLISLAIYQSLNADTLMDKTGKSCANHDNHIFVTWTDLLKGYEFILRAFKTKEHSIMIITCDSINPNYSKTSVIVKEIEHILSKSTLKQVIAIAPQKCELLIALKQKIHLLYDKEFTIDFSHLTAKSQNICLTTKKIRFQEMDELVSIHQMLVLGQQRSLPNEILSKLNLDASVLEILLKNHILEIGCEKPKLSRLDAPYYQTHKYFNSEQLKQTITDNPLDMFAFVGEEIEVRSLIPQDHQQEVIWLKDVLVPDFGRFILLTEDEYEKKFHQLCYQIDLESCEVKPLIHLFIKGSEKWIWTCTYYRQFYMERNFFSITIDEKKIKEELTKLSPSLGYIIFSGINEESLMDLLEVTEDYERMKLKNNIAIFLKDEDAQKKFENITNSTNKMYTSIHWIKINKIKNQIIFQWFRSTGDVSQLCKLVQEFDRKTFAETEKDCVRNFPINKPTLLSEKSLAKSTERLIIIADEPGMGKTTTLARMAELMKIQNTLTWIIKFDLNKHQVTLGEIKVEKLLNLIDLLSSIDQKLADPLTRCLLMYQLTRPGHVILLWDGFDEVKSERQDNIITLFKFIKNETKAQIWITTRRHDQRKLEQSLSTLAYPFKTLDKEEQIDFLSRFWQITLKLTLKKDVMWILKEFANKLITDLKQSTQICEAHEYFISVPLRARILAEIYQEKVEKAVLESKPFSEFLRQLKLGNLYQQFIDRKYDIYLREKIIISNGLDEDVKRYLTRGFTKAYGILALKVLFNLSENEHFSYDREKYFSLNVLSRIGLIQGNEEPANFIHRTFAEYFAAKLLADKTENSEVTKFVGEHLFKNGSRVIRRIYDSFITQNLPLHKAVIEDDVSTIYELLRKNCDINKTDALGRTVLHLAVQDDHFLIIQTLQKSVNFKFARDKLGKTALHYAAAIGHPITTAQLLHKFIDIDLKKHIFRTPLHLDEEIGNSIFNNDECVKSKLVALVNEKDEAGRTALYYAVDNENWETASIIISHGADVEVLTTEQKLRFLHHYVENNFLHPNEMRIELFPVIGLLLIHGTAYDVCAEQDKFFENQHLQKRNPIFIFCYLIFFFLEYTQSAPINALVRNVKDKKHCFRIANESRNLRTVISCINSIRSSDNYNFNEANYLKIVRYLCKRGREIEIELLEEDRNVFLNEASSLGFLETFQYLYEFGESETDIFQSEKFNMFNKGIFCGLFSNTQNLNFDNLWLQKLSSATFEIFGWTQLHLAAMNKNSHSIELFLNASEYENINREDRDGMTPLTTAAAIYGRSKFIESFITALKQKNFNKKLLYEIIINKSNNDGRTALHFSMYNGDHAAAEVILKTIKDIGFDKEQLFNIFNVRDSFDASPLQIIINTKNNMLDNPKFIIFYFNFIQSINFSSQQCIEILEGSRNLLHVLILCWREDEALSLLKGIASLPLDDDERGDFISQPFFENNDTPLHAAALRCLHKIILSLLKNGAIFNVCNKANETPLDVFNRNERSEEMNKFRTMLQELNCGASSTANNKYAEELTRNLENYQRTEFLLSSFNRLFEVTANEQIMDSSEKLDKLRNILNSIKGETWIEPESILNARNREGKSLEKTLIDLSEEIDEVTDILRGFKDNVN